MSKHAKAVNKYIAKNYAQVKIAIDKDIVAEFRDALAVTGETATEVLRRAMEQYTARVTAKEPVNFTGAGPEEKPEAENIVVDEPAISADAKPDTVEKPKIEVVTATTPGTPSGQVMVRSVDLLNAIPDEELLVVGKGLYLGGSRMRDFMFHQDKRARILYKQIGTQEERIAWATAEAELIHEDNYLCYGFEMAEDDALVQNRERVRLLQLQEKRRADIQQWKDYMCGKDASANGILVGEKEIKRMEKLIADDDVKIAEYEAVLGLIPKWRERDGR